LENYGWIPVEVTGRVGNKSDDFFGRVRDNYWNGIIFSRDTNVSIMLNRPVSQPERMLPILPRTTAFGKTEKIAKANHRL